MKVAIVGSREFDDYELVCKSLEKVKDKITLIISGGARGADSLAERFAIQNNIKTLIFKPDWDKYGKKAGFLRNKDIISSADIIIAFWDGNSAGTASSIDLAESYGKPIKVILYKNH